MAKNPVETVNFPPGRIWPEEYQRLFAEKCAGISKKFSHLSPPAPLLFASPPEHYRMRAEFRIWHQEARVYYAMMTPGKDKTPLRMDHYAPGSTLIQQLMPVLYELLNRESDFIKQLFQVEFLTSLKGEALITFIYHRPLDEAWIEKARQLKQQLSSITTIEKINVIGRSRGQKVCVDQDFIYEQLTVDGIDYCYQQVEGSFTQPNALVNVHMLNWASSVTKNSNGDLLELYCGNGNFTLPLSKNFNKVLATEVSKTSIQSLLHNFSLNQINNIKIARLSSAEAALAIQRVRPFQRLTHIDLDDYHFTTVFVDPPRAGLDAETLSFVQSFDSICYISCNPDTLIANLEVLTQTHTIKHLAYFDQFPYTPHMECGVLLERSRPSLSRAESRESGNETNNESMLSGVEA